MAIEVKGYRLLVKPDIVDEIKTEAGIVIATDRKLEQAAVQRGILHSVGSRCWEGHEPYAAVGDYVIYSKYAGKIIEDPEDNEQYIILNDEDILAVCTGSKEALTNKEIMQGLETRREAVNG